MFCLVLATGWSGGTPAQQSTGVDPQEVAEVLTELEEAGAPATAAEIAEFLHESAPDRTKGTLLARSGWNNEAQLDHTIRLGLVRQWLTVKGRWRQYRDGTVQAGGAVIVGHKRWQLAAGQLGLAHGFGLLVGAPGRGPSLTADGRLGSGVSRLVPWAGTATTHTVLGAGLGGRWGRLGIKALVGRRGVLDATAPLTASGQITASGEHWQAAALVISDPAETGASLAASFGAGAVTGSGEGTWRQPAGADKPLVTLVVQGGWQPHRMLRLEFLAGWADLGPRPVMGQKHPVFGDWAGQGVAVRGTWRGNGGLGVKLLIHQGRGRDQVSVGQRRVRTLADALLTQRWPGGWHAEARWREGGEEVAEWSERFPWQAPVLAWRDSRRVLSLKTGWRGERGRSQILWRRLTLARQRQDSGWVSGGVRGLVSLSGVRSLPKGVALRVGWTLSWGDPVDLVSAVVPFGGYVLPRHWGHWRAEKLLGVEKRLERWQFRAAVSWRQAEREAETDPSADTVAAWLEGVWSW